MSMRFHINSKSVGCIAAKRRIETNSNNSNFSCLSGLDPDSPALARGVSVVLLGHQLFLFIYLQTYNRRHTRSKCI